MVDEALKNLTGRAREFLGWFYGREEVRYLPIQNRLLKRWWVSSHAARENLVALDQRGLIRVEAGYIHPVDGVKELVLGAADGSRPCPTCGCTCRVKKEREERERKRLSVTGRAFASPFRPEERRE